MSNFGDFSKVTSAFYGEELDEDHQEKIEKSAKSYLALNVSNTPKVQAVIYHISEFCSMKGMGLAPWSEQCTEHRVSSP